MVSVIMCQISLLGKEGLRELEWCYEAQETLLTGEPWSPAVFLGGGPGGGSYSHVRLEKAGGRGHEM